MPKVHSAREKISRQQPMLAIGAILSLLLAMAALSVKDIYAAQDAASQRMSFSRRAARALELHGLRELAEPASRSTLLEDQAASRSLQVRIQAARACYLLLQKQSRRARELLEEAAKLAPDVYEIRFLMAEVDSREDDARALRACNQLIKQYPKRIEAYELKGRILEANGKAKEAMAVYSEALKRWPAVNQMIDRLVRLAFAQGDLDVVIDISKRRLKREPRRFEALFMLAYVEELKARAGKDMRLYSDSASHYETALEVQPRQTKLYQRLSEVYTRLDRREKAVATLRRGLVVDPTDRDLQKAFEQAVSPKGNADDVLAAYQSLAEEYSNSADILDLYAAKLMAAQKFGDARKQLENVLKLRPDSAKTLLDLGGLALRDGDNDKARKHFERAADLASQNPEIFERIGSQYAQAGHSDQAVQFLERARAADPGRLTVYYALAQAYQEMGKMDKAVESLQSGLAAVKQPRSRKALLLALAVFQQIDEKYGQALATLRKAYELDRNDIQTFFALANLVLLADDNEGFDKLVTQGWETFKSTRSEFRRGLAELLMQHHRYSDAVPVWRDILKEHPDDPSAYVQLATAYQRLRESDNGERLYAEAGERLGKDSPNFYRFAAQFHSIRYENQKASEALVKLLEKTPIPNARELAKERFMLFGLLFSNLSRQKKYDEIGRQLERAEREIAKLDSEEMRKLRARALTEMKRHDDAIALYRTMVNDDPDNPETHYELGAALNEAKRDKEAEESLRKALELVPKVPLSPPDRDLRSTILNHIGYMFAEAGIRLDEARQLLSEALRLEPRAGHIVDSMGWLEFKQGNVERALELVKKAVDYSSEDPVLYDHLGDIYAKSGDKEKALENWRQAIRLDPQFEEVKAKIDETSKGKRRAPNREQ